MTYSLARDGFEVISGVISSNAIFYLNREIECSSICRSRAGMRHALDVEAVRSLAFDPAVMKHGVEALGRGAFPFRATLFDKSHQSNWLVVWHQDTALPLRERRDIEGWGPWSVKEGVICAHAPASALESVLAIRIHLDDSTDVNGPLQVLPGTHTRGVLSDDAIHELVQQIPAFGCHARAGDLVLMKPLLVHASSKAKSDPRRRVLHIEYSSRQQFAGGLQLPIPEPAEKQIPPLAG